MIVAACAAAEPEVACTPAVLPVLDLAPFAGGDEPHPGVTAPCRAFCGAARAVAVTAVASNNMPGGVVSVEYGGVRRQA